MEHMSRRKNFPPTEPWSADDAINEVASVARWARDMGYVNIAPRLEWAVKVLRDQTTETPHPDGHGPA